MRLFDDPRFVELALVHYRQPHRFYHDAAHVEEMIALARQLAPDLSTAEQLAVLWHDAVYVPGAGTGENERLSARLMRATLAQAPLAEPFGAATLAVAEAIILATTHSAAPPPVAARMVDLDLYRLGTDWDSFDRHAMAVWQEYRYLFAGPEAFLQARQDFYRTMLEKPSIYATALFRDRFEASARANLRRGAEHGHDLRRAG